MYQKSGVNGKIVFEDKVIQNVVGIAVSSCYGVVEMASVRRFRDRFFGNIQKDYYEQGIVVNDFGNGIIDLEVHVVLGYSIPVKSVTTEIKKRVAYELEKNLNIKVRQINIFVDAIDKIG